MKETISQMMEQAQKMQADLQKAQAELANAEITGESGAGMVRIVMTCRHQVQSLDIDDSLIGDDKEMLEDLVTAAFNDAIRKVEVTVQEKFSGLTSGMGLPAGLKLPF